MDNELYERLLELRNRPDAVKRAQELLRHATRDELIDIAWCWVNDSCSTKDLIWHAVNTEYDHKLVATGEPRVKLSDDELRLQLIEDLVVAYMRVGRQ